MLLEYTHATGMPWRGGARACTPGRKRDVANRAWISLATVLCALSSLCRTLAPLVLSSSLDPRSPPRREMVLVLTETDVKLWCRAFLPSVAARA